MRFLQRADSNRWTDSRAVTFKDGKCTSTFKFPDNKIKTAKYTWITFLPKNLFEQLQKFGNCYFLFISFLMYLGEKTTLFIGTIKAISTLGTLLAMMAFTAVMALIEDRKRTEADKETNNQTAHVVRNDGSEGSKTWENVKVGDVIVVMQDEEFPADIVPLYCTGPEGTCYVSTANLDGETNLKLKAAPAASQKTFGGDRNPSRKDVLTKVSTMSASVDAEPPKASIHDFSGRLLLQQPSEGDEPLGPKQLLLRGTRLRNTAWCVGVVVYTGQHTRMVMNSREAPLKQSNLERVTNRVMLVMLVAQGGLSLTSDLCFLASRDQFNLWYLFPPTITLPAPIGYWLTFFVLYSNLMPISLYPTIEVCNAAQSYFIKHDAKMFYRDKERDFQMPAGAKSATLCQELGQVNFIFSDKTGTLTQNVMELKKILVNDSTYGRVQEGEKGFHADAELAKAQRDGKAGEIDQFMQVLAVAHTVVVSKGTDGKERFEAESPDESALVEAVARLGWAFKGRQGTSATVQTKDETQEYSVLATNQFDSTRKRMSVVVKFKEKYLLLCKGADNVMMDSKRSPNQPQRLTQHLSQFAQEGLRTLVIARKELDADTVNEWLKTYNAAERTLQNRDEALANAAEEIEVGMTVVGATAIEDKLQDEVPQTITLIRQADIKLWVLTGDKLETARNIGFSSKVLTDEMKIVTIDKTSQDDTQVKRDFDKETPGMYDAEKRGKKVAMLITGFALEYVEADTKPGGLKEEFLKVAAICSIVIACRVSPLQKAQLVRMVREGVKPTPVTLAIGDGANDVPMIQEAQVGVGIAGHEGRQAMNNADFSIGQFRFLQRLLFVHGRWNYRRVCKFTLFTFWRNAVQVLMIFYYTLISGFSGTSVFEDWIRLSFNFLCSFPIMATGCFDQDVDEKTALQNPDLYIFGREGLDLNPSKIGQALVSALAHSLILMGVTLFAFESMDLNGVGDYYTFGTVSFTCLLVDMNYRVAFLNYTHNRYTMGSILVSFGLYTFYLICYPCCKLIADMLAPNMYMVPLKMIQIPIFWLCLFAVPATAMIVDMIIHTAYAHFDPNVHRVSVLRKIAMSRKGKPAPQVGPRGEQYGLLEDSPSEEQEEEQPGQGSGLDLSELAQQRCKGIQWNPDGVHIGWIAFSFGLLVMLLGYVCYSQSMASAQIRIHYDGVKDANLWWQDAVGTDEETEVFDRTAECARGEDAAIPKVCRFNVTVPQDMTPPILLYYAVGPFFQNYNDYLKSEVIQELMGKDVDESVRESKCIKQTRVDSNGNQIVPCGMKATSVFNDTFEVEEYNFNKKGIAWPEDIERYNDPPSVNKTGVSSLRDRYPQLVEEDKNSMKNEQFLVWMRPSALWRVWNPYARLENTTIMAGTTLTFNITSNYPVVDNGYKQLVLTSVGPLGGRHNLFGILLMCSGVLCWFLALCVCICRKDIDAAGASP
mmetsp:Transcript_100683/g.280417  ORF Transcript_100683/g.280417 Transcript_100683/m.280417 type:complete len:1445 (-) Transcript_100683:44-4378(-)